MAEKVIPRLIEDELKVSYLTYAMSVIVSRALPDVRDGLKPVHRRILYAMYKLGMVHSRPYKKCATVVGEVLGKYHPHGDQAIYDTLVRMAQEFSLRHVLIDGQGNFGSIDGDMPAAMRYTESRMSRLSDELLKDIQKETVDFQNNFDDTLQEPTVLPAAFPNLLVNGTSGIAVGMATSMLPHNLREVTDALKYYIDNRDCSIKDLMRFIKAPDFPTRGIIYGLDGIKKGYETGKGIFKVRSRVSIEEYGKNKEALIITEIPYQVNKAEMIKKMAELVKAETIKGISEIRDESDKDGVRVVIELKKDVNAQTILNLLFKHTPLESSFSINAIAIVNGVPRTLNLKEIISHFTDHRFVVITRRTQFDLRKAEDRLHIVEGLIKAVQNIDEVVRLLKKSKTVEEAEKALISTFSFSSLQAKAILDMRLARLVSLEITKLENEFTELTALIAELKDILAHPDKIYTIIKDENETIAKTFSNPRKTEIVMDTVEELDVEDYIHKTNVVIALTKSGYIKRSPVELYRRQSRGGVGVKGSGIDGEEDVISLLEVATTHDTILFITNLGRAFYIKVHEIPEASRIAKGTHMRLLLGLNSGEEVKSCLIFESFEEEKSFILITSNGIAKKCAITDFVNAKKRGITAISIKQGDSCIGAVEVKDTEDIIITSRKGLALRAHASLFRIMGRAAGGVRAMRISPSDEVIGIAVIKPGVTLLVVSEKGYGKKIDLNDFNPKGRGGKGQIYMKINEKTGELAAIRTVSADENVLVITSSGNIIRINADEVSVQGRPARGTRLVNVKEPDIVVDAAVIHRISDTD